MAEGEERWTIQKDKIQRDMVRGPDTGDEVEVVRLSRFEEVQAELERQRSEREKAEDWIEECERDLERAQEAGRQLATELRVLAKAVEPSGNWAMVAPTTLYRMADLADGGALAEARERGET